MPTYGDALQWARQLLGSGQLAAAESIYQQLLAAVPEASELWHEMGIVQLRARRPEAALDYLRQATLLDAGHAEYHGNLGVAYRALQQYGQAITSFQRAVELGPPNAELYNNLALALKDAGQREAALLAFDAALLI